MRAESLFDENRPSTDADYLALREDDECAPRRSFVDALWSRFHPFADRDFKAEFARDFAARYWEMYLGCTLLDCGFELRRTSATGPDFDVWRGGRRLAWIEAIAPKGGSGRDAVPETKADGVARRVPDDEVILRYRAAIEEKREKFVTYIANGVIDHSVPHVIAISGAGVPSHRLELEVPRIVRAVLPIGHFAMQIEPRTGEVVSSGYERREAIAKKSGSLVSTTVFCDPRYAGLAAIIYAAPSVWDWTLELGHIHCHVHNPLATRPLDRGWLPLGVEYFVEHDRLQRNRYE